MQWVGWKLSGWLVCADSQAARRVELEQQGHGDPAPPARLLPSLILHISALFF